MTRYQSSAKRLATERRIQQERGDDGGGIVGLLGGLFVIAMFILFVWGMSKLFGSSESDDTVATSDPVKASEEFMSRMISNHRR